MPARSLPHKRQILISFVIFFTMALVITIGDYVTAQKTVLRESQNYAEKIASHISTLLLSYTASHGENPLLYEFPDDLSGYRGEIKHIMTDFNLFNVKVFNNQGEILFSMDPEVIGRTVEEHGGFEQAMAGKSTSRVATPGYHEKIYGSESPFPMLETYVPVYHPDTGEIMGVYEIYQDYRPLTATVRVETFRASLTHIILLLIFAMLFFRYGLMTSRLLEEEQERMINDLEDRVEERTLELKRSRNRIDDLLKKTEEMYRELKISDEYQKNFIGLVSHELRTPLTVIKGYLSLLEEGVLRIGEPETSGAIETSLNEAKHLESIIENIIELTQLDQGVKYLTRDEIDTADILNESIKMLQKEIEERQIEVAVNITSGVETFHSDRISILHVLNQLLSNAIKFSPLGGKVELYAAPSHRGLFFSITDRGVGIPKPQQEEIFNRFYQADISSTRSFEGSGLGLAIVKKISKVLGGRVWVESSEGAGSTFHFEIPEMPEAGPGNEQ
jgi:signal transduction histidine kinase